MTPVGPRRLLARNEADQPEKVREYMRLAEEQIANLNRIARQALSFARVSESSKPIDLVDLAEAALRIHQRTIASKEIHLVKDLPGDLIADVKSGQILQVVSNILANALESLPDGGTLSVRLRKCSGCVSILIADNGHGIEAEHFCKDLRTVFHDAHEYRDRDRAGVFQTHRGRPWWAHSAQKQHRDGRSGTAFKIVLPT